MQIKSPYPMGGCEINKYLKAIFFNLLAPSQNKGKIPGSFLVKMVFYFFLKKM